MKELILSFPNENQVIVEYIKKTSALDFTIPLTIQDRDDIRWYLEVYGIQYTTDLDDTKAERIENKFIKWGDALFNAACPASSLKAREIFLNFYRDSRKDEAGGIITIDSGHPDILSLPWELLCVEKKPIIHRHPHITVRRRLSDAEGIDEPYTPEPKETLHLLFVVSRPEDAGFIDPRADARAVMDALDQNAPGRVTVEFLRPATLDNLTQRLRRQGPEHKNKPPVDILHFDGHGVFDAAGHLHRKAVETDPGAAARDSGSKIKPDTGYLLFEDEKGKEALITAETLGNMLTNQKVALTVLSACQSGAVGVQKSDDGEETEKAKAINGVAARLTQAGLPGVIAMSHTVLVETTRRLFGQFYARLGDHMGVGAALDEARQHLYAHPERGERRRGEQDVVTLRLYDWFLPALYQTGDDPPLLEQGETEPAAAAPPEADGKEGRLPAPPQAGFWGRSAELWKIERAFLSGARRITVTGFGGQGKTALAAEAGGWLKRTGMFEKCCFVSFAAFQGVDPVSFAVSSLSVALGQSLIDAAAAETALAAVPALVILDNLESLKEIGDESADRQAELLDAAARWSRAGASRVLITTRQHRLEHPDYPEAGSSEHRYLDLDGLNAHDAVAFFTALWELPPDPAPHIKEPPQRHGLVELFKQVGFHPLSISLLAYQLKSRAAAELGERLENLLADAPGEGADKNLRVSLELSLERLPEEARKWLPRLGVFRGGAMEDVLLEVTGIGMTPEMMQVALFRKLLDGFRAGDAESINILKKLGEQHNHTVEQAVAQIEIELSSHSETELTEGADESTWPELRRALETAGLIRAERLHGTAAPFLKFHPALAPALWERLPEPEKDDLSARHRAAYYRLSGRLYHQDNKEPLAARAVAMNELPNLLFAVRAALKAGEEDAVDFVNNVNSFLGNFGLLRDRDDLNRRAETAAGPGSRAWYLAQSNKGEALRTAGHHGEAEAVFRDILTTMGKTATYEYQQTLGKLGRCLYYSGRTAQAAAVYREGIALSEKLEQSNGVRRQTGILQTDLADVLTDMGDFSGARVAYEAALEIAKDQGDDRQIGVVQGQLGTLSMLKGNLAEAERRHSEALQTFRRLNEPRMEAMAQGNLGNLYQKTTQWDAAEAAYREAARLLESLGNFVGAAQVYNELGSTMTNAGRTAEAETWYRRGMEGSMKAGDHREVSRAAGNLANLLQNDPARLPEARNLAEQALAIKKTLDPGASEIWTTYAILAKIADKQGEADQAREYRRLGREARENFMGTQHQVARILEQLKSVIEAVVAAIDGNEQAREELNGFLAGWQKEEPQVVDAINAILKGDRDEDELTEKLSYDRSVFIRAILARLRGENPYPEPAEQTAAPAGEHPTITQQQLQIAAATALPALAPETRPQTEPLLDQLNQTGRTALAAAIPKIWDGERDPAALCTGLNENEAAIIQLALHFIEHPEELKKLMEG